MGSVAIHLRHPPSRGALLRTGVHGGQDVKVLPVFSFQFQSDVGSINWSYEEGAKADLCKFYLVSKICIDNLTKVWYLGCDF